MNQYTGLIQSFIDPVFWLVVFFLFRKQIIEILGVMTSLLTRLRKGSIFGQTIEIDETEKQLRSIEGITSSQIDIPVISDEPEDELESTHTSLNSTRAVIYILSKQAPKEAVIQLMFELQQAIRNTLVNEGLIEQGQLFILPYGLEQVSELDGAINGMLIQASHTVWSVSQRIIFNEIEEPIDSSKYHNLVAEVIHLTFQIIDIMQKNMSKK